MHAQHAEHAHTPPDAHTVPVHTAACTPNSYPHEDGRVEHGFQINVVDDRMTVLATIDLPEWEHFLPASAGHRLIEHGWMILPHARGPKMVNGWHHAGIGWITRVIRTEHAQHAVHAQHAHTPTPLGDLDPGHPLTYNGSLPPADGRDYFWGASGWEEAEYDWGGE